MTLARAHYAALMGAGDSGGPGGTSFVFVGANLSGSKRGYKLGDAGTVIQDTTGWDFTEFSVLNSYGDLIITSAALAADVVANGAGGRVFTINDTFSDQTINLGDLTLVGDSFTYSASSISLFPGVTYTVTLD